ncbi:hypothetical protein DY000_02016551 [Brassica cretica]|uniref:Uncharacterized protein n=1 Tax=Brassica cretica TaxID=69181 RepID=A0ABQ7DBY6_BRACR|nr:hypothetical protein DY000_02016551 [Brassica cretica]
MLALVVVPIRSSRLWETPKGGELMGVDMLLLDEKDLLPYGQSSGKPSEQNTYADIEAAYKCLEENYGAKQENIIRPSI